MKKEELKKLLDEHNIITYREIAVEHADKMVPIAHQFIKDITSIISPSDYEGQPNEFIEMVLASQSYVTASLIIALYDMFPEATIDKLQKNYKLSLNSSINLQMRNHSAE